MTVSRQRRATLPDVAALAGVSTAAAGRALGGYGSVSEEVRQRVLNAAEQLNYRANRLAASVRTGRTDTIGVVCADIESPFFARALRGISDVAHKHGFSTLVTNSDEDLTSERNAVQLLLDKQVDGIICAPADVQQVAHLAQAQGAGTPVVLFDRMSDHLDADAVIVDGVKAAYQAVSRLIALGHERIAIVAELRQPREQDWARFLTPAADVSPGVLSPSEARLLGYLRAHWDAGVPVRRELVRRTGAYDVGAAYRQMKRVLALKHPPTAVFLVDNLMTVGSYRAIRDSGISVPERLSVLAFDDLDWTVLVSPALSVIAQPVYEMGAEAARQLIARIRGGREDGPGTTVMDVTLIERESTAPVVRAPGPVLAPARAHGRRPPAARVAPSPSGASPGG
ncbi:LacI family DNA-binding transcriptional regulator [Streptosporangium fragile]|uniref:LacI family DNA-binding transcriptional regulator n=1 Tax=Streptosporangium fragile TaxID=46186 RepID=A0ABN3W7M2_9ACTN